MKKGLDLSMQHSPEDFTCPICKQIDRVEKVSAVYEAGTSIGAYSGGTVGVGMAGGVVGVGVAQTNMTGMSQTNRSLRLAPPPQPQLPQGEGCGVGLLLFLCFAVGLVGLGMALADNSERLIGAALFTVCTAGFVSLLVVLGRKSRIKKAEHAQQIVRWQQAVANWERLYYCGRNDVVFIPGNSETCVPAYELYKLL
ncbi:hypothetical protein KSF_052530 [Reticulibacter mediterranei]|uniref:Transmembrane protein n=2 Tax=Reticulibacter mediterranei TaxID=2778369 RepID=A0A8J3IQV0_9CHLR|nr:hypothetical protein KSF_052530 [Reticulibacter mediterranei]